MGNIWYLEYLCGYTVVLIHWFQDALFGSSIDHFGAQVVVIDTLREPVAKAAQAALEEDWKSFVSKLDWRLIGSYVFCLNVTPISFLAGSDLESDPIDVLKWRTEVDFRMNHSNVCSRSWFDPLADPCKHLQIHLLANALWKTILASGGLWTSVPWKDFVGTGNMAGGPRIGWDTGPCFWYAGIPDKTGMGR